MLTISTTSSKGGVGKSTTCAALACYYADPATGASPRGKVHVLDLDPNQTLATWSKLKARQNLTVEACAPQEFPDAYDRAVASKPDVILIDLAGFLHADIFKAFARSDLVIVPAGTSAPDLKEAGRTIKHIANAADALGRPIPYRLLLTRMQPLRNQVTAAIVKEIARAGLHCFETAIIERVAYKALFLNGMGPHEVDPKAEAELANLVREICSVTTGETHAAKGAA